MNQGNLGKREGRSTSLGPDERHKHRFRQRQASVGTLSVVTPNSKSTNDPDPASFVHSVPVVSVPTREWAESHQNACMRIIKSALAKLEPLVKTPSEKLVELTTKVSVIIQDNSLLLQQRISFRGRGLESERPIFYLIYKLHSLKYQLCSLQIRDFEDTLAYVTQMQSYLQKIRDFSSFQIAIDINGYLATIPHHKARIAHIQSRIAHLEKLIKQPKFLPPPEDFAEQLIYPTSTTAKIFTDIEKQADNFSIEDIFFKFQSMTDDEEEMSILLEHAFSAAWRSSPYPFIRSTGISLPTFLNVPVRRFEADHLPEKYANLTVNCLQSSGWPYSSVVSILSELFFHINPMKMARRFYDALMETANCVANVTGQPTDVDFDTLFPLILICVLASGIPSEPKILLYIASLAQLKLNDSYCQLGSSYAEAILTHLLSLNEEELSAQPHKNKD